MAKENRWKLIQQNSAKIICWTHWVTSNSNNSAVAVVVWRLKLKYFAFFDVFDHKTVLWFFNLHLVLIEFLPWRSSRLFRQLMVKVSSKLYDHTSRIIIVQYQSLRPSFLQTCWTIFCEPVEEIWWFTAAKIIQISRNIATAP